VLDAATLMHVSTLYAGYMGEPRKTDQDVILGVYQAGTQDHVLYGLHNHTDAIWQIQPNNQCSAVMHVVSTTWYYYYNQIKLQ